MQHEERVLTEDGSHTLVNDRFAVPYHSTHGAITESQHVFIKYGLLPALAAVRDRPVRILEMGFGTGLNALLTVMEVGREAYTDQSVEYFTYEAYPVTEETVLQLNYPAQLNIDPSAFLPLHRAEWEKRVAITENFFLEKFRRDFIRDGQRSYAAGSIDVIYYDAFAPSSQPEFWEGEALAVAFRALRPGGWLTTYCAQGQFKRNLRATGFLVEGVPGPPGKREMTIARKPE
ncbi:tRNA (5-methylaminomethyl-2-thiouridine)(34)-methyltransferase MnmD [Lewinella sp. W8]|uniref:tRNA (5-methylaminomethyl-2-thiouridine)(34)-methyltransferase MnmD n=1 Tax=Lewinella sp. W8 TaxID=2528208 RepID=UPI001068138E|nr:tRNA (5-methylaminomethyl-2-thiouridine)(34)-methyltransferase MnmD [Lewinella sp. W8]MTB49843.1 tRNA (5-methylaminomethyl-2-thiouridine)(34)-methyltransferase MnmD [Lewinella sp. W8]